MRSGRRWTGFGRGNGCGLAEATVSRLRPFVRARSSAIAMRVEVEPIASAAARTAYFITTGNPVDAALALCEARGAALEGVESPVPSLSRNGLPRSPSPPPVQIAGSLRRRTPPLTGNVCHHAHDHSRDFREGDRGLAPSLSQDSRTPAGLTLRGYPPVPQSILGDSVVLEPAEAVGQIYPRGDPVTYLHRCTMLNLLN